MKGRTVIGVWVAAAVAALSAHADTGEGVSSPGGSPWTICAAQTATGVCTALPTSGEERVAGVEGFVAFTAFAEASTATSFSCRIIGNAEGHDAADADGDGTTLVTVTSSQRQASWSGVGARLFANCATITGGAVTIIVHGARVAP